MCFLQALPEAAGHNGETKAPVDHFYHIAFNSLCLLQVILPFHGVLGCVE